MAESSTSPKAVADISGLALRALSTRSFGMLETVLPVSVFLLASRCCFLIDGALADGAAKSTTEVVTSVVGTPGVVIVVFGL